MAGDESILKASWLTGLHVGYKYSNIWGLDQTEPLKHLYIHVVSLAWQLQGLLHHGSEIQKRVSWEREQHRSYSEFYDFNCKVTLHPIPWKQVFKASLYSKGRQLDSTCWWEQG